MSTQAPSRRWNLKVEEIDPLSRALFMGSGFSNGRKVRSQTSRVGNWWKVMSKIESGLGESRENECVWCVRKERENLQGQRR